MAELTGIQEAVQIAGSTRKLADLIGVSQPMVCKMVRRGFAPSGRVLEIEGVTGVPRKRLMDPKMVDLLSSPFGE